MDYRKIIMGLAAFSFMTGVWLAFSDEAQAIPAFARTHNVPCSMCHVGFPKLNAFGKAFEHRGFRMAGEEGKFLWEQPIPLAGRIDLKYEFIDDEWSPDVPGEGLTDTRKHAFGLVDWQLLTGGTLAPKVSFFGQIVGKVPGLEPDATDSIPPAADALGTDVRTEAFWVQINDLLPDHMLNLRVGKDHVDSHYLSAPLRLTYASYLIQFQPLLGASLHPNSISVGLNGTTPVGLDYEVGVRNYGPLYNTVENDEFRIGSFYAFLNQHVMGQTATLMVSGDRRGDENLNTDDDVLGTGLSFDLHIGNLNVIPGIFWYHEGPRIRSGNDLDVLSGTIEILYSILPTLLATARFDINNWDIANDSVDREARQYVVSFAWYQYPNVRWVAEYSRMTLDNLKLMRDEVALFLLAPTAAQTDLTRDKVVLLLEVDF